MNQIQKLSQAERLLAETEDLSELQNIHDIARAAEAYAQAHRLGIANENHARKIKFLAARRIGELVPAEQPKKAGEKGGRGKKAAEERQALEIPHQRFSEFRALAEVPKEKFDERIAVMEAREEKITYNRLLRGDWYQMSETPEWETPQWLFDLLDEEFHFEVDVCASKENHKCKKFYSKDNDGLKQDWRGTCWMNPPYGRELPIWMSKAKTESENGAIIVCLVPARTDTEWWWNNCIQGQIRFIRGRLHFSGKGASTMPNAIVILGQKIKPQVIWWNAERK